MKQRTDPAGRPALASIIAVAAAAAAMAVPGPAHAQGWAATLGGISDADIARAVGPSWTVRGHRIAYYRGSHFVPLGALVRESGTASTAAWQARANLDRQKIGVPPAIKADKDGDGVDDAFDRWPNDPTRW